MIHTLAVLGLICVVSYLVVTFHSAVIAKLKAETSGIIATARKAELEATYFEQNLARRAATFGQAVIAGYNAVDQNVKSVAGKIVNDAEKAATDIKAQAENDIKKL